MNGRYFCLFLAVTTWSLAQGSTIHDCLNHLYDPNPSSKCIDYNKAIVCLKNITDVNPHQVEGIQDEILYLEKMNNMETCLVLGEKGTCVEQEIHTCTQNSRGAVQNVTQMCRDTLATYDCLVRLNNTCSNEHVVAEINFYGGTKVSCESGAYKKHRQEEKCYAGIETCTGDYYHSYNEGNFTVTCEILNATSKCLETVRPVCDESPILSIKDSLDYAAVQCGAGFLTGPCSYIAIENCTAPLYEEMDDMFGKRSLADSSSDDDTHSGSSSWGELPSTCTEDNISAVKQCLNAIKPACKSELQMSHFNYYMEDIDVFCQLAAFSD